MTSDRSITDAELVESALSSDGAGGSRSESAYADLLRRYERPVFTLILRMVRDRTLAEDLAQDTFVKAFSRLSTYDPSRKFSSWLFKVAHNTAIDHLRRREVDTVSMDEPVGADDDGARPGRGRQVEDEEAETPDAAAERSDLSRAISRAVGHLRPEYREVVTLRYQGGLEYGEIVEATGFPLGTVKTYLHRARKELAQLLAAEGFHPEAG